MDELLNEEAASLQAGAYDLHVHSLPSVFPRLQDGLEVIRDADRRGMAGILLKSHYEPTALRASLINKYSGCRTQAYGGLALNWPNGGLNPYAVENALRAGAKVIWMPTRDALNSLNFGNMSGDFFKRPGISVIGEDGKLKKVVFEIMDIVREHNAYLATGHISPQESIILCKEGRARQVPMILTHPEFNRTKIDGETQKKLADLGVLVEKNWFNIVQKAVTPEEMARNIRTVGVSRVYIATDRGQRNAPSPVEEYGNFIKELLKQNFTMGEIFTMTHTVPKMIVS
ncbi:MAG: DUF6282 family protein [Acidaminococcus provencensis]|uniref:DUF6282 family protein n=1 Tax=Acidaminococcus provencensis TaxID=2058289 RepID=UPI0022E3FE73|nr:DUF6282 family protein [Acidaminococcus provencensis]MCH4096670.1 DUF6282 family protein [Acidaminococcus provencensis]